MLTRDLVCRLVDPSAAWIPLLDDARLGPFLEEVLHYALLDHAFRILPEPAQARFVALAATDGEQAMLWLSAYDPLLDRALGPVLDRAGLRFLDAVQPPMPRSVV